MLQDPINYVVSIHGQKYEVPESKLLQFCQEHGTPLKDTLTINEGLYALLKKLWTLKTLEEVKPGELHSYYLC